MNVLAHIHRGVVTDNVGYMRDIDTSRDKIGAHQSNQPSVQSQNKTDKDVHVNLLAFELV